MNYTNQFNFPDGWSGEFSGFYMSPATDAQFTHIYREQANIGVAKKLFSNKVTVKDTVRDVFRDNSSGGYIQNIPNVIATYHTDNANRALIMGFTYNFGSTFKNDKKHDNNSADAERSRAGL